MVDSRRPAWSRDSMVLRLPGAVTLDDITDEWAFGGADGSGVRVAVVDSGIDADHPGLAGCVDEDAAVEFGTDPDGNVVVTPGRHSDSFGHGTACAGIIHSLAPAARITSVKVLGPGLSGKAAAFHAGLSWAVEQGFDVINLSLGTRKRDWALAFHEVCDQAYFAGSFLVTAANNVQSASYPSLYASVASVACNLTADPRRYHANPEPPTEFLARGIDVPVLWLDHGTTVATGNSYAAPHIAGLAALVRSKHADLRPFQVKTVLWARAANVVEATAPEIAGKLSRVMSATALLRLGRGPAAGTRVVAVVRPEDPAPPQADAWERF
jgi:subtilisin family serine protease